MLHKSIEANGFENVTLHPYAVAEAEQTFMLKVGGRESDGRIVELSPSTPLDANQSPQVKAVVLDHFLPDLPQLDVVKMDIEGAEPRALQGMMGLIRRYRPILLLEYSPRLIQETSRTEPERLLRQLEEHRYAFSIL